MSRARSGFRVRFRSGRSVRDHSGCGRAQPVSLRTAGGRFQQTSAPVPPPVSVSGLISGGAGHRSLPLVYRFPSAAALGRSNDARTAPGRARQAFDQGSTSVRPRADTGKMITATAHCHRLNDGRFPAGPTASRRLHRPETTHFSFVNNSDAVRQGGICSDRVHVASTRHPRPAQFLLIQCQTFALHACTELLRYAMGHFDAM